MTTAMQTTRLTSSQLPEAGAVLGRAFFDDPLLTYILPDESKRGPQVRWFMEHGAKYGQTHGEVYTTVGKVEGNAVWLPPGEVKMTMARMARAGLLFAPFKFGVGGFNRFLGAVNYLEHLHERDLPQRHWYLLILGVDPPRQGQGVGGALIQPVLARADAEGLPCYLETMKTRNVPFYQKHGFEVVVEDDLPKGGCHFWTMKRMPR